MSKVSISCKRKTDEEIVLFAEYNIKQYLCLNERYIHEICFSDSDVDDTPLKEQAKALLEPKLTEFVVNIEYMLENSASIQKSEDGKTLQFDMFGVFRIERNIDSPELTVSLKENHWFSDEESRWIPCNTKLSKQLIGNLIEDDKNNCLIDYCGGVRKGNAFGYTNLNEDGLRNVILENHGFIVLLAAVGTFDLQKKLNADLVRKYKIRKYELDSSTSALVKPLDELMEITEALVEVIKVFSSDIASTIGAYRGSGMFIERVRKIELINRFTCCCTFLREQLYSFLDQKTLKYYLYRHDGFSLSHYIYFLREYQDCFEHMNNWDGDSPSKLMYLLRLDHPKQSLGNSNFFSYENLISSAQIELDYNFPSKAALRGFLKLPLDCVDYSISPYCTIDATTELQDINEKQKKRWFVLMQWLQHSRLPIENTAEYVQAFKVIQCQMHKIYEAAKHSEAQKVAFGLDVLFSKAKYMQSKVEADKHLWMRGMGLIDDFITDNTDEIWDFLSKKNACQTEYNLNSITSKVTIKSLTQKIKKWHQEVQDFSYQQLKNNPERIVEYNHPMLTTYEVGQTRFIPLISNLELMEEGIRMNNCVFSFDESIREKEYLVFMAFRGDERATVGLDLSITLYVDQCYLANNQNTSEELRGDVESLVKQLRDKYGI